MKSKAGNQYYFTDEKRCESCGMIQDNCMCYKEKQLTRYCKVQGRLRDHDGDFSYCSRGLGLAGS